MRETEGELVRWEFEEFNDRWVEVDGRLSALLRDGDGRETEGELGRRELEEFALVGVERELEGVPGRRTAGVGEVRRGEVEVRLGRLLEGEGVKVLLLELSFPRDVWGMPVRCSSLLRAMNLL